MKKYFILSTLILFIKFISIAQPSQQKRVEYSLKEISNLVVKPFKNSKTFLTFFIDEEGETKKEYKYNYEVYDVSFNKIFSESIFINKKLYYHGNVSNDEKYFELYFDKKTKSLVIYKFDSNISKFESKSIPFDDEYLDYLKEIKIIDDNIYFTYVRKKAIQLIHIDYKKGDIQIIDIPNEEKNLTYLDLQLCNSATGDQELHLKCYKKIQRKVFTVLIFIIDKNGSLKNNNGLNLPNIDEETQRRETSLAKLIDGNYMVVGTYTKDKSSLTNGIYVSKLKSSGGLVFDKTFNYLDLPNFTNYLSDKIQGKIEKKKNKAEAKGQELNLDYHSTIHDVIEKDGKYYLIFEFYYPTYRTETYSTGKGGVATRRVFDGYLYTHGIIASLDETGKMVWSNIFELKPSYKPFKIQHFIVSNSDGENINLLMESGNNILSKSFSKNGKLLSEEKSAPINTMNEDDIKISTYSSTIAYWYDKNFLCFGSQKIKSEDKEQRKRKVYFINKVTF